MQSADSPLKRLLRWGPLLPFRKAGAWALSKLPWTAACRLYTGQAFHVDLGSCVGRSIWLRGRYEPPVEALLRQTLTPGDVFLDVGANLGYFSIIASPLVGDGGEVHAFEPEPRCVQLLQRSLQANGIRNLVVNPTALWSEDGLCELHREKDAAFSYTSGGDREHPSPRSIPAMKMDTYVPQRVRKPVRLIKMDIEGGEVHALSGGLRTLAAQKPTLILEVQDWSLARQGHSPEELFRLLGPLGYRAFTLGGEPLPDAARAQQFLAKEWIKNLAFRVPGGGA